MAASDEYPKWRYLAGFAGEDEAWRYVSGQGIPIANDEGAALKSRIHHAVELVRALPDRSAVRPDIKKMPESAAARLAQLEADPRSRELLQGVQGHEWVFIELANLRCFQQNINSAYVETLMQRVPRPEDINELMKFCLPLSSEREMIALPVGFNPSTNTWTIVSENLDFRLAGNVAGEASPDPLTPQRPFVGFFYGFGSPQLSVGEYKGAYVIRNGYHRAMALLRAGHTHAPVLLARLPSYQTSGGQQPGFLPPDLVLSTRPPLLKDYLTEIGVDVPRRRLRVVFSAHAEVQVIGA